MNSKSLIGIIVAIVVVVGAIAWYEKSSMQPYAASTDTGAMPADQSSSDTGSGGYTVTTTSTTTAATSTEAATSSTSSGVKASVSAAAAVGATKSFTVTGQNYSMSPSTLTVNKGDKVKITFKNAGGTHNFNLDGYNVATPVIQSGGEASVEFTADKAGTFDYYCSIGNHRAMGMQGVLTVK